jgi:hypothetical protein
MTVPGAPCAAVSLRDIANSTDAIEIERLLGTLRHPRGPSLRDLPGGQHGPAAQQLRRQTVSTPTSALRASVHQTLQLLDNRPQVDPEAYAASRRRLGTLMSQRAVEDDWITRLRARRGRLGRFGEQGLRKALDADIETRKQQRRRLINRERHAERVVDEHERRHQALHDWHTDHLYQLAEAQCHAQALLARQEAALDLAAAVPPGYLLAELGGPPERPEARQVWRQGALAILRFRKDHHIEDPNRALGQPSVGASHRLRRSEVQVVGDQARQLINQHGEPAPLVEPLNAPDIGLP